MHCVQMPASAMFLVAVMIASRGFWTALGQATGARKLHRSGGSNRGNRTHYDVGVKPLRQVLRDVSDVRVWPAPISERHSENNVWAFIGGPNLAATGPDCPFLQRGPSDNLTVCEQACADDGSCNTINYSPQVPDCVFRACADPLHPQLTPYANYSVYSTTKTSLHLDTSTFTLTAVGYEDEVLTEGMARYAGIIFPYGPGTGALPPNGTLLPGLRILVSGSAPLDDSTDETYVLSAPDADGWASLTARTVYGALHGLETFSQVVQFNLSSLTYSMVPTRITDGPRFSFRGLLVDTSRHFISIDALKLVMDQMAYVKLNVLHLHLTDDQSWPLELTSYPLLAQRSAYSNYSHTYSHADVAALVRYAGMRGIRVIPEFDTPSHFSSLFNAYPEYAAVAYNPDNTSFLCLVDISKDATFDFLAGIWGEIASLFPDSHMFIGGDEFWDCWNDSPAVSAWMKANNMTVGQAYHYYERRMIDIVRGTGRKTMAWLDVEGFPLDFAGNYSAYPDVSLNVWTGCYSGSWQDDVAQFVSQNMSVVVSGPFYVTQQNGSPNTPHFTWQQMYSTDLWNFTGSNVTGSTDRVLGGELCAWDDAAQTDSGDLWISLTPYMLGVGEAWWSPQSMTSGVTPDEERAHGHRCRMIARGVPSHPVYAFGSFCPFEYEPLLASWDRR